jgi:hypothetical protein
MADGWIVRGPQDSVYVFSQAQGRHLWRSDVGWKGEAWRNGETRVAPMTFVEVEYRMQVVKTRNKVVNRASNDDCGHCEDSVSIGSSLRPSLVPRHNVERPDRLQSS